MDLDTHHARRGAGGDLGSGGNRLPVFVFPGSISFYSDDNSSHRQLLTLYNPYDFLIKFKVLSTAPHKYSVVDPEGSIRARCYVDISRYHNISDEFRIWMYQPNPEGHRSSSGSGSTRSIPSQSIQSGCRDVTATLYPSKAQAKNADSNFEMAQSMIGSDSGPPVENHPWIRGTSESGSRAAASNNRAPSAFLIAVSIACAMILLMPNSDDDKPILLSFLPPSCIPGIHLKLCAAYVLGCVTKPLIWP